MANLIEKVVGDLDEKKEWRELQRRVKKLPEDYALAYAEIQRYIFKTSGIETIKPLESLVDLFEEGAADKRGVLDITGTDVAAFADELTRGERGYFEKCRTKLNRDLAMKLARATAAQTDEDENGVR